MSGIYDNFEFLPSEGLSDGEIYLRLRLLTRADDNGDFPPTYSFRICREYDDERLGEITLRVGFTEEIFYAGHIGYTVYPEFRGNHYAEKACRLIFEQAKKHGMDKLYITCNPDNTASIKTCKNLNAKLIDTVWVPEHVEVYKMGDREKCIFEVEI